MNEVLKANQSPASVGWQKLKALAADAWEKASDAAWLVATVGLFVAYPLAMSVLEDRFMSKYSKLAEK